MTQLGSYSQDSSVGVVGLWLGSLCFVFQPSGSLLSTEFILFYFLDWDFENSFKQEDGKQSFHLETKFKQKQSGKEPAVQPASPSLGRLSLHSHH